MDGIAESHRLIGFQRADDLGYALPVFGDRPGANRTLVATSEPEGGHRAVIARFRECRLEKIEYLPDELVRDVARGGPWVDVFLWEDRVVTGDPNEIWAQLGAHCDEIAKRAPLSLLDLAMSVEGAERLEEFAATAQAFVKRELGAAGGSAWAAQRLSDYFSMGLRRHSAWALLTPEDLAAIGALRLQCQRPGSNTFLVELPLSRSRRLQPIVAKVLGELGDLLTGFGASVATIVVDDSATSAATARPAARPGRKAASTGAPRAPSIFRQYELVDRVQSYNPTSDERLLNKAYVYSTQVRGAYLRARGEDPRFERSVETAGILTDYRMDDATITAALLTDVLGQGKISRDGVEENFGAEVAELVQRVRSVTSIENGSDLHANVAGMRKFVLAVSKDARVLMVKIADHLQRMRTLSELTSAAKRERIARITLNLYAPVSRMIGCQRIAAELEDLAFAELNPVARDAIVRRLAFMVGERGAPTLRAIAAEMASQLGRAGLQAEVSGFQKDPFAIWRKLQTNSIGFSQLSDIYTFRIIVGGEDDCYAALGAVHRAWPCVPDEFEDFISRPRPDNYRSIHTTVVGSQGFRVAVQIRTPEMDRVAEEGLAAYWQQTGETYGYDPQQTASRGGRDPLEDLRRAFKTMERGGSAQSIADRTKLDLYGELTFVFTPQGKLVSLPHGAMPLDLAYALHTDIGDTTIGCRINGELKPLRTALTSGDVVEVIRGGKPVVPPDWRSLTVTGRARSAIRRHIRQTERDEFIRLGRVTVDQAFEAAGKSRKDVSLRPAMERFAVIAEDELFDAVGRGRATPAQVLETVFPGLKAAEREAATARRHITEGKTARLYIRGGGLTPGVTIRFGQCCTPVPGDRIVGVLEEEGSGLVVHTIDCGTLEAFDDNEDLWLDLQWTQEAVFNSLAIGALTAVVRHAPAVLGRICASAEEAGASIRGLRMTHRSGDFAIVDLDVQVRDVRHLGEVSAALRANPNIESIERRKL